MATGTVELDQVSGSAAERVGQQLRYRRMGRVKDIDLEGMPDAEKLLRVMSISGVPQWGEALSANYTELRVERIRVETKPGFQTAYLVIDYSTPNGFTPTTFLVRNDGYAGQIQTNVMPNGQQILMDTWTDPNNANNTESPDSPIMSFFSPVRSLSFTSLRSGTPPTTAGDYVCHVNNAPWPTQYGTPKPAGYWMLMRYSSETSVYQGYSVLTGQALTRNFQNWSEQAILRSRKTGKYVQVDSALLSQYVTANYIPNTIVQGAGFVVVRRYPWTNFATIFGF